MVKNFIKRRMYTKYGLKILFFTKGQVFSDLCLYEYLFLKWCNEHAGEISVFSIHPVYSINFVSIKKFLFTTILRYFNCLNFNQLCVILICSYIFHIWSNKWIERTLARKPAPLPKRTTPISSLRISSHRKESSRKTKEKMGTGTCQLA